MQSRSPKNLRRGFTLVEVVLSLVVLSALLVGSIKLLSGTYAIQEAEIADKSSKLDKTSYQERLQKGFLEQHEDFDLKQIHSESPKGRVSINTSVGEHKSSHMSEERHLTVVHTLNDTAQDLDRPKIKLNAPIFLTDGNIPAASLPLSNYIKFPQNPLGTYYTYTVDGTDPGANSTPWDHRLLTLLNVPKTLKLRAFNADHIPSDIASIAFSLTWDIKYEREDPGTNQHITRHQIDHGLNKIALNTGTKLDETVITYKFDPNGPEIKYTGPFHIPLEHWTAKGAKLYVNVSPKCDLYPEIEHKEYEFKIQKTKLPTPKLQLPDNLLVKAGDRLPVLDIKPYANVKIWIDREFQGVAREVVVR